LAGTTHNDVLSVGMCPKMRPVGVTKKGKKGQKLSCVKLDICPDHPRRHRPLKFGVRGSVREVVIYLKFHENRSRGLGPVGGRKSPSPIDKAYGLYNSLYYRTSRDITANPVSNPIYALYGSYFNKLMYKMAVYRLVNGAIAHQKQQISETGDDAAIHRLRVKVLPRNITFFQIFAVFDV